MTADVAIPEVAYQKTDAEFIEELDALHDQELADRSRLDLTIFEMGDKLVQWNPDHAQITMLARKWGMKTSTLEQRQYVAHNIPKMFRNEKLSYSAHVECLRIEDVQARNDLIAASSDQSANLVRVAVRDKRIELGEIKEPRKPISGTVLPMADKLNFSGGFDIYDGKTVLKVRGTIVNGEVELSISSTNPFDGEPTINTVGPKGTRHILEGFIAEADEDDENS